MLVSNLGSTDRTDAPLGAASIEAVRSIFDTNFFSVLAVTQAMLPLLRKPGSGRVIDVFDRLGSLTHNGDPAWELGGACSNRFRLASGE